MPPALFTLLAHTWLACSVGVPTVPAGPERVPTNPSVMTDNCGGGAGLLLPGVGFGAGTAGAPVGEDAGLDPDAAGAGRHLALASVAEDSGEDGDREPAGPGALTLSPDAGETPADAPMPESTGPGAVPVAGTSAGNAANRVEEARSTRVPQALPRQNTRSKPRALLR